MANTRVLTTHVEDYVRERLCEQYGMTFSKQVLTLTTGGKHEFDAVSSDRSIVGSIKATSGLTASGRVPMGKFHNAISEIYYLSLVKAPQRVLFLTYPAFYDLLTKKLDGALPGGITIRCVPLSPELQLKVDTVMRAASLEVSPAVAISAVEAEMAQ